MKPAVLALSGSIASGKSTLSRELAQSFQWSYVSFGDYVRSVARNQGLAESRESLQLIGTELLQRDTGKFCRAVLAQAQWQAGQPIIVDGIRHVEVLDCLRQIVAPIDLYLIFASVDEVTRSARLLERGTTSLEKHQKLEQDSTEQQVKTDLVQKSDLIVSSTQPLEILIQQISNWLESQCS
ncbi:MAG: dephospho-CoA kinase [Leptolyngbya sp. UWPOB_LEPTO1]|uniref:AAA family ATPase n=1 Tax=Leptolyngbya sp. UWPOB_LEPTO1 TaxID=2815653 RepID=UPI001ACC00ED|nr:AAA family ATPase [Leptolyngbya sp. UWPOB_LEPTO1]MBN8564808.1 dephospho-CoA kinase [Leptolyngbya sp. UWPOB_LEPTO1]